MKIDQLVFEENEMCISEIQDHLNNCDTCDIHFKESMEQNRIVEILRSEPLLNNPDELTNSILSSIDKINQNPAITKNKGKVIRLIRRSLAAASVLIMIVFGVEQYTVVQKIMKLEESATRIESKNSNRNIRSLVYYNTGLDLENSKNFNVKEIINPVNPELRTRITRARLSVIVFNQQDNSKINKLIRSIN